MAHYSRKERIFLKLLGNRIRLLRKKTGLSQEAFADAVMLDRTYIGSIERGERNLAAINLKKLSEGLDIPLNQLFKDLPATRLLDN